MLDWWCRLSVLPHFIKCNANVFSDLSKQDGRDVAPLMKWNRGATTCGITELFV
jgi:hypothetical protein